MSVYPAPSNVCNNELPLCLSKCFSFCLREFVQFWENAEASKLENAMSPPIGESDEIHPLIFSLLTRLSISTKEYFDVLHMK